MPQESDRLGRVIAPPRHRRWTGAERLPGILALAAFALTSCERGQTRDQADFWQEAFPEPVAVLQPWLSTPVSGKVELEEWSGHVVEITPFLDGPEEAGDAQQTVLLRDAGAGERRLHLRLAPGVAPPLFRNEALKIQTFSRLADDQSVQRSLIVLARRPLGTGADFRPVIIVARHDDLIPPAALPKLLTGMARTEQLSYREAHKGEGECTVAVSHFLVSAWPDARAAVPTNRRRPTYAPGSRLRRQDHDAAYDVAIHDARRSSVAPCPMPDETALVWSATWTEDEAAKVPVKPQATAVESVLLPQTATPSTILPPAPARKSRKPRDAQPHAPPPQRERQAPHP